MRIIAASLRHMAFIPATPKPVSTSIPGETGISTSIRISAQDINSAPKAAAAVTQDNPQAKAGTVNVDFGSYNLKEDTTITVRTLPEKTDAVNGYTAALWSLDAGSQKEFILPVTVTVTYDSQVTDPEAELEAQCWNEDAGAWENVSFTINTSSHTITMTLYQAGLFGIFRDEAATKELADTEMVEENLYRKAGKNTSLSVAAATKLLPTRASYEKYARFINTALQERQFNDILNNRLSEPDEYEDVLNRSLDSTTNISNGANIVVSFGDLICQQFSTGSTATKAFLSGSGSVLCGIGLGMAAVDYAKKTVGGGQSDKEYFLNAWPELLLTASSIPSFLGPVAGFLSGSGAATTAAAAAGTTLTPWLAAIAAVAVFVKSQTVDKEEPPKIQHAELLSLMRVCAEETWFNPKTGKLHLYLPEKAVNRLTALKESDYGTYGLEKSAVSKTLSRYREDTWKANYVRLGSSRYPNYSGWAEIMDYITKKYKGHPEKWIEILENYAESNANFGSLSSAEANALSYALLGTTGVGDSEFGIGKYDENIHKQCQKYIYYEIMDGLQNNKFFKRFAEKFMDEVVRINRRNWLKQKKELKRELTFTLVDKKGVKVSFDQFKEYQDKFICFKTAPSDFTLRAPWRVNMDSSTLATSTYLGYIEMGCHVKQIGQDTNADATQELLVYDSMEDCIRGETPVSRIFFTGPLEYGQKEVKVTVDGTPAPQTKPTATPAPTAPAETGDVELSETLVIFQGLSGSRTLTLKGAGNGRIIWSTNAGVGKIVRLAESADGKSCTLTPVAYGSDTVWASYGDKIYKCMVYVEKEVQFDQTAITLKKGETAKLSVINADNATVTNLDTTWSVGNAAVASLSEKTMKTVVIKAEGTGTTTITKKYNYGDGSVKILECRVTVEEAAPATTPIPAPTNQPTDNFSGEYYGARTYMRSGTEFTTKYKIVVTKESNGTYTWDVGNDELVPGDLVGYFVFSGGKASVSNGTLSGSNTDYAGTYSISVSGGVCTYCYESALGEGAIYVTLYRK